MLLSYRDNFTQINYYLFADILIYTILNILKEFESWDKVLIHAHE